MTGMPSVTVHKLRTVFTSGQFHDGYKTLIESNGIGPLTVHYGHSARHFSYDVETLSQRKGGSRVGGHAMISVYAPWSLAQLLTSNGTRMMNPYSQLKAERLFAEEQGFIVNPIYAFGPRHSEDSLELLLMQEHPESARRGERLADVSEAMARHIKEDMPLKDYGFALSSIELKGGKVIKAATITITPDRKLAQGSSSALALFQYTPQRI